MNPNKHKNVINIGQKDPEAIARAVGVIDQSEEPAEIPVHHTSESSRRFGRALLGAGTVAAAAFLLLPRGGGEAPTPPEASYTELAQNQADIPLSDEDTVLIDGIKVKAKDSNANTASEAILGSQDVKDYIANNPNQSSAITASAMSVPSTGEYAIVERDIDGDGDGDAVAVPVESKK